MTLAWPESPSRRADVVVGAVYVLVDLWSTARMATGMITGSRFHGSANEIAILIGFVALDLLFAAPGIGMMKGIRQGFVLTAILSGLALFGSLSQWLIVAKQPSGWYPIFAAYNFAIGAYSLVRLRSFPEAEPENSEERATRPVPVKILDRLTGTLNAISVVLLVGMIFASQRPAQSPPSSSDSNFYLIFGGLFLIHLALCAGVALGRRWAFILIVLWLAIALSGEVATMRFSKAPVSIGQISFAVLHAATIAYGSVRSKKPKLSAETP